VLSQRAFAVPLTPVNISRLDSIPRQQPLKRILSSPVTTAPKQPEESVSSLALTQSQHLLAHHASYLPEFLLDRSRVLRGSLSSNCWIAILIGLAFGLCSLTPVQSKSSVVPSDLPAPQCGSSQAQSFPRYAGFCLRQLPHLRFSVVQGSTCGYELMNDGRSLA
jgi:hypothetical protein